MKYILIIWVCSFLEGQTCMPPMEFPTQFDSWYACSRAAHQESIRIMSKTGFKKVNELKLGVKYNCKPVRFY